VIDVVVDTNVLVAAFRSSLGASYRLLQTIEGQQWRPVISPSAERGTGVSISATSTIFTEYLCSRARLVQIYFRWRPMLPDPDEIVFWR
jgi:predicted nucleic acid-binding protein